MSLTDPPITVCNSVIFTVNRVIQIHQFVGLEILFTGKTELTVVESLNLTVSNLTVRNSVILMVAG